MSNRPPDSTSKVSPSTESDKRPELDMDDLEEVLDQKDARLRFLLERQLEVEALRLRIEHRRSDIEKKFLRRNAPVFTVAFASIALIVVAVSGGYVTYAHYKRTVAEREFDQSHTTFLRSEAQRETHIAHIAEFERQAVGNIFSNPDYVSGNPSSLTGLFTLANGLYPLSVREQIFDAFEPLADDPANPDAPQLRTLLDNARRRSNELELERKRPQVFLFSTTQEETALFDRITPVLENSGAVVRRVGVLPFGGPTGQVELRYGFDDYDLAKQVADAVASTLGPELNRSQFKILIVRTSENYLTGGRPGSLELWMPPNLLTTFE